MKIGLSSYSISRAIWAGEMNILDAIRWIAEKGGEHMEVVPGAFQIKDAGDPIIQQIRDTAKECGIAFLTMQCPVILPWAARKNAKRRWNASKGRWISPLLWAFLSCAMTPPISAETQSRTALRPSTAFCLKWRKDAPPFRSMPPNTALPHPLKITVGSTMARNG